MDAAGNILWKGKYPDAAAVEAERLRIGNDKAWIQEFLLRIVSDSSRVVHPEWIHYEDSPPPTVANRYRGTFIGIDPAISEDRKAACTAMVAVRVFGWGDKMRLYVMPYPVNERMEWPDTVKKAKEIADAHGAVKIYVEDFGMQRGLAQDLSLMGYAAEYYRPSGDKRARLALVSPHIKNGTICFSPRGNEELVMQIVNFDRGGLVDLVDALTLVVPRIMATQEGYRPFPEQPASARREPGEGDGPVDVLGLRDDGKYAITRGLREKIF